MDGTPQTTGPGTRHLGLDLGATNLKWAVVEHADGAWSTLAHGQVPTRVVAETDQVPAAVTAQLAEVAAAAIAEWGPSPVSGSGCPASTTRHRGNRFWSTSWPWASHPCRPVAEAVGVPTFLVNDARAFGLAELRLGAGRGPAPWSA
jgi:predicted NBD/HSP70 family sugar kinase